MFTFGVTTPGDHNALKTFIAGELKNMDWYIENDYTTIAQAIAGFVVGFSLFNYAVPKPDRAFLHLYYRIFEEPFFAEMSDRTDFLDNTGKPKKSNIVKAIHQVRDSLKKDYPNIKCPIRSLDFSRKDKLAKSYLQMITQFDTTKK